MSVRFGSEDLSVLADKMESEGRYLQGEGKHWSDEPATLLLTGAQAIRSLIEDRTNER